MLKTTAMFGVFAALGLACLDPAAATMIEFKPTAEVTSAVIRLRDVADIRDADPETSLRLGNITLAPSPLAGQPIRLQFVAIRARLQAHGVSLETTEFTGSRLILVSSRAPEEPKPAAVRPASLETPSPTPNVGQVSNLPTIQGQVGNPLDEMRARHVVAVKQPVPRGYVLQENDLTWIDADATAAATCFESAADVVGKETTRPIGKLEPLQPQLVRSVSLVKPNDLVTVYARSGPGITVKRPFKAKTAGAIGDMISLVGLDGRQTLLARVTGFHKAEVVEDDAAASPEAVDAAKGRILFRPPRGDTP